MSTDLPNLSDSGLLDAGHADVGRSRERRRRQLVRNLAVVAWTVAGWMLVRVASGASLTPGVDLPRLSPQMTIVAMLAVVMLLPLLAAGRSPHVLYRPGEIEVGLDDVRGASVVREEVVRTLNLFLAHKTFRDELGGNPRRAILFEGPPGTGKTHLAKAMAGEAGVPFLFVSSSAFQSMYHGQTNRKIRSYFRALRTAARQEGGAIGFIEELDAIGSTRSGMGGRGEGIAGVVNELLIQLQSFDEPTAGQRARGWFVDRLNRLLPADRQRRKPAPASANILVVGATNRADDLDPALLRPGRFDRTIHFDLPTRSERREIVDYYLAKKAHAPDLDDHVRRDTLAAATSGYSPVMIEHLLDEALVWALRRGAVALDERDIAKAKLAEEVGLGHPVEYTEHERRLIATHEAGHAVVAYLAGRDGHAPEPLRRLDVLSIIKRGGALGVTGHSDRDEHYTRSRRELEWLVRISFGGMAAEELVYGEAGSGVSADLAQATTLAAAMVGSMGMGGSLISLDAASVSGAGNIVSKVLGDDEARQALERILGDAKAEVVAMMSRHRRLVEALRDALLDRTELVGDEIIEVIERAEAGRRRPRGDVIDLREGIGHTS